jgi:soluble lytic murein transglycosylase
VALFAASPALAAEPFCDELERLGGAAEARRRADPVAAPGPSPNPAPGTAEPGAAERLLSAERLLLEGEPAAALAEAELAAWSSPPALAGQANLARALALAALGRFDEATELARPLALAGDPGLRRGGRWLLARAAARAGRTEEATAQYAAVAAGQATVPGLGERRNRELGDESAYLAAWLWYDAGAFGRAVERLDAFVRARPGSSRAD